MTNILATEQVSLLQNFSRKIDSDVRSRYWTFLFDNLKRSIEQIYQTCQSDQNSLQCQVRQVLLSSTNSSFISFVGDYSISSSALSRLRNAHAEFSISTYQ